MVHEENVSLKIHMKLNQNKTEVTGKSQFRCIVLKLSNTQIHLYRHITKQLTREFNSVIISDLKKFALCKTQVMHKKNFPIPKSLKR